MFVWTLSPNTVFIYENPKSSNVFCSLATSRCAGTVREMLILHFLNLYVLFNVEDTALLRSIISFIEITVCLFLQCGKKKWKIQEDRNISILVAKSIKSALELLLSSSGNSNKDIKVLLSSLYMNRKE